MSTITIPTNGTAGAAPPIPPVVDTTRRPKSLPKEILPTDRLSFDKQVSALRAFVVAYGASEKPVTNEDAGKIADLAAGTIVVTNAFFCDVGLLQRQKEGDGFIPSEDAISYVKAYKWDPDKAREKLKPTFERTWFARALVPLLKFRTYDVPSAMAVLAEKASATKEYEARISPLIDYLVFAGAIVRDGSQLKAASSQAPAPVTPPAGEAKAAQGTINPPAPEVPNGMETHTLLLNHKEKRKFIVYAPPTLTTAELERIRNWLGLQIIITDEQAASEGNGAS